MIEELICELIKSINRSLFWNDIVKYALPIIGVGLSIIIAIASAYKYFKMRNREYYEKILNDVYAPLYQFIVKMEFARKNLDQDILEEKEPIFELEKIYENGEKENILKETDLLAVKQQIECLGLIPNKLLILLNEYEMCKVLPTGKKYTIEKYNFICQKLKDEIIKGYIKYQRKLGLYKLTSYIQYDITKSRGKRKMKLD